jgi:hypothetical protein
VSDAATVTSRRILSNIIELHSEPSDGKEDRLATFRVLVDGEVGIAGFDNPAEIGGEEGVRGKGVVGGVDGIRPARELFAATVAQLRGELPDCFRVGVAIVIEFIASIRALHPTDQPVVEDVLVRVKGHQQEQVVPEFESQRERYYQQSEPRWQSKLADELSQKGSCQRAKWRDHEQKEPTPVV